MDPSRLRYRSGSLEAVLLESSASLEPPPSAEDEIWLRLKAGATTLRWALRRRRDGLVGAAH
jgi:hypothetical protein